MFVNQAEPLTAWNQTTTILSCWKHKSCTLQVFLLRRERERERLLSCDINYVRATTCVLETVKRLRSRSQQCEVVVLCGNTVDYFLCGRKESETFDSGDKVSEVWIWDQQTEVIRQFELFLFFWALYRPTGKLQWDREKTETQNTGRTRTRWCKDINTFTAMTQNVGFWSQFRCTFSALINGSITHKVCQVFDVVQLLVVTKFQRSWKERVGVTSRRRPTVKLSVWRRILCQLYWTRAVTASHWNQRSQNVNIKKGRSVVDCSRV